MHRRLVVFSDPGGAKPCLTLAERWAATDDVLVCSDRHYSFFGNFSVPVISATAADAERVIDSFDPAMLYTATSYTSLIEIAFLTEAANRKIPSAAFVDHYTGFCRRFGGSPPTVLPDEIHVIDEYALAIAIETGIPSALLRVTGNPYHTQLRSYRTVLSREALFQRLRIPVTNNMTMMFAPDPLSRAGGRAVFGTDEVAVSQLLCDCLRAASMPYQLLVKPHPNQPADILLHALRDLPPNVQMYWLDSNTDALLNDVIQNVDLVIGIMSNILVEAKLLGTPTVRLVDELKDEYLAHEASAVISQDMDSMINILTSLSRIRSISRRNAN